MASGRTDQIDVLAEVIAHLTTIGVEYMLTGGHRVTLACEMFGTMRALVEARVRAEAREIGEAEVDARVFERLFPDLDEATRRAVTERIRAHASAGEIAEVGRRFFGDRHQPKS